MKQNASFWTTLLILAVWVACSTLYIKSLRADHDNELYNVTYELNKLKTENEQLRKVRKQCFEEREKARRGAAVRDYW